MADEIRITAKIKATNGNFTLPEIGGLMQVDQTTPFGGVPGMVSLPAADTAISTTGITDLGWMFIRNCDLTNFITYGPTSGGAIVELGKLLPGEWAILRLKPGITLRAKADTAACKVQILILDA